MEIKIILGCLKVPQLKLFSGSLKDEDFCKIVQAGGRREESDWDGTVLHFPPVQPPSWFRPTSREENQECYQLQI